MSSDPLKEDHYLDKYAKQKTAYKELDSFVAGEGGLQYFPVPDLEWVTWKKEQSKKNMEEWERKEAARNKAILDLRTDPQTRGNGHNDVNNNSHCDLKKKTGKSKTKK